MSVVCLDCQSVAKSGKWKPEPFHLVRFAGVLFLYLCYVIPGVLYTLWRIHTRPRVCRACESPRIVPEGSPRARQLATAKSA